MIDVECLPKLGRDAQVINATAGRQLFAGNFEPLLGLVDARYGLRIDVQPKRGRPRRPIFHEADSLTIPREQHGARPFEPLSGENGQIRFQLKLRLYRPVGPHDARDLGFFPLAQAEMQDGRIDDLLLRQKPRANPDLAADSERIDALIAGAGGGWAAPRLPVIVLASVIEKF